MKTKCLIQLVFFIFQAIITIDAVNLNQNDNDICRGIPKEESEGMECFLILPSNTPSIFKPPVPVDCFMNFKVETRVKFRCEKLFQPSFLSKSQLDKTLAVENNEENENDNKNNDDESESRWRFSTCLGADEWEGENFPGFRCEIDSGFIDDGQKSALISGGKQVALETMPWTAAIFHKDVYQCGGTLISLSFVLTAAHCFKFEGLDYESSKRKDISEFTREMTVILSTTSGVYEEAVNRTKNPLAQIFKIGGISIHPEYSDRPAFYNDIALLQLDRPVKMDKKKPGSPVPILLPDKKQTEVVQRGGFDLLVNGFGVSTNGSERSPSKILYGTNVTSKNVEECEALHNSFDNSIQICGVAVNNSGVCKGDSGSGVFILDGKLGRGRYSIQGIVSFGTSKISPWCFKNPVFTRVKSYLSWIDTEKKRLAQQYRFGQDSEKPPKIQMYTDFGILHPDGNGTFQILEPERGYYSYVTSRVFFKCSAPYPVQISYVPTFINKDDPFSANEKELNVLRDVDLSLSYSNFSDANTYTFVTDFKFAFHSYKRNATFSCESLQKSTSKKSQTVEFFDTGDELLFSLQNIKKNPREEVNSDSSDESSEGQMKKQGKDSNCSAFFYYGTVSPNETTTSENMEHGFQTYGFSCKFQDGEEGRLLRYSCPTRSKCRTYFDLIRPRYKNCWKKLEDELDPKKKQELQESFLKETNFVPFIPVCLRKGGYWNYYSEEPNPDAEVSTPIFYGLPSTPTESKFKFNSRPEIFFEGDASLSFFGSFEHESMIKMDDFSSVQLINSMLQVRCHTSHFVASSSFQFALKYENESNLRFLPIETFTHHDQILNSNVQTITVHLNDTRIQRIFCFGAIENKKEWMNASRPVQIQEQELNILQAEDCFGVSKIRNKMELNSHQNLTGGAQNETAPRFTVQYTTFIGWVNSAKLNSTSSPLVLKGYPKRGHMAWVRCYAPYPIQIRQIPARFQDGLPEHHIYNRWDGQSFEGYSNTSATEFRVEAFLFYRTGQHRIFRCESISNPQQFYSLLEYSYSRSEKELAFSLVAPPSKETTDEICKHYKNNTEISSNFELGGQNDENNDDDCAAIFYYEERKDFPFFAFRCEFPFGRAGNVTLTHCDSPVHCLNLYRGQRQSKKCWRKWHGTSISDCKDKRSSESEKGCGISKIPVSHRPFVAKCVKDAPGHPQYIESDLGSFAFFGLYNENAHSQKASKLYFEDIDNTKDDVAEEIIANSMISMDDFDLYRNPNETLDVTCRASNYYTSGTIQFAIRKKDSTELEFLKDGGIKIEDNDLYLRSRTKSVDLKDGDLEQIYCFAGPLTSLRWINASRSIVIKSPEPPTVKLLVQNSSGKIRNRTSSFKETDVMLPLESQNYSITCDASGFPPPTISWATTLNHIPDPLLTEFPIKDGVGHLKSQLFFPSVQEEFAGTFICRASNTAGSQTKSVRISFA